MRRNLSFLLLPTLMLLIGFRNFTKPVLPQSGANTGQIVGQVLDQSGASVAGTEAIVRHGDSWHRADPRPPRSILTDLQIHNFPSNGRRLQDFVIDTPAALIERW